MDSRNFRWERGRLQAALDACEGDGLKSDVTPEHIASLKSQIAYLDFKIGFETDA